MSELKNCGTVEKLIEMFEKHDQVEFELLGVGNTVFRTKYFENAIEEIKAWNTLQPRFSEAEREALERIMDNAVTGANSEYQRNKRKLGNIISKQELQRASDDLIAVRSMLYAEPIKHTVDCSKAEKQGGKCTGYGYNDGDDEPIEQCKICPKNSMYGLD